MSDSQKTNINDRGENPAKSNPADSRKRIVSYAIPLLVFATLVALFIFGLHNDPTDLPAQRVGQSVPEFALPTLDDAGARVTPAQLLGKPYLLNVWATWCPTCYVEHPFLLKLAKEKGVRIIGVNYKDDAAKAHDYINKMGNPYELILVDSGRLGVDLGVYGAPETFVISADGKILYRRAGDVNESNWNDIIAPLMQDGKPVSLQGERQ